MNNALKQIKKIRVAAALASFFDLMNKISSLILAATTLTSVLSLINQTKKSG